MINVTLAVEDRVFEDALAIAQQRSTTLNDLIRGFLSDLGAEERRLAEARRGLLDLMDNTSGRLDPGFKWDREELYAERLFPRHQHSGLRSTSEPE